MLYREKVISQPLELGRKQFADFRRQKASLLLFVILRPSRFFISIQFKFQKLVWCFIL